MHVYLYNEPLEKTLDLNLIEDYCQQKFPALVFKQRPDIFTFARERLPAKRRQDSIERWAKEIAKVKITDLYSPQQNVLPLKGEIEFEKRRFNGKISSGVGLIYEAVGLQQIFWQLIPEEERRLNYLHIIFTTQLIATFDTASHRFHLRVSLYGFPSIISTSGVVEAPAKPREYYALKQQVVALSLNQIAIQEFKEKSVPIFRLW